MPKRFEHQGILVKWIPDRGYGFVITTEGQEVFTHISEFLDLKTAGPPAIGQRLKFDITVDGGGGRSGKARVVRAVRSRVG